MLAAALVGIADEARAFTGESTRASYHTLDFFAVYHDIVACKRTVVFCPRFAARPSVTIQTTPAPSLECHQPSRRRFSRAFSARGIHQTGQYHREG